MKKSTWIRIIAGLCMIALAVTLGIVLDGVFSGPDSQMWQRMVYIFAVFGTGLSGIMGIFSAKGFYAGYIWVAILDLAMVPELLPEPWNRYTIVVILAALFIWMAVRNRHRKTEEQEDEELCEEEDELTEEEMKLSEQLASHIFVMNPMNGRAYQLFCRDKELLAYRVGGEIKGVDAELAQIDGNELRPLGKKDFSLPLSSIRSVKLIELYGGMFQDQAVVRTGRKTIRLSYIPLNDPGTFAAFWKDILPGKVTQKSAPDEKEDADTAAENAPDEERMKILKIVKVCMGVYIGAVNLAWLFLDVPYKLFSVLSLIALPVLLTLYFCFPKEFTMGEGRSTENRISLVFLMFVSGAISALRTMLDFNIMNVGRLVLVSAIALVLMLALFLVCSGEWKKQKMILAMVVFTLLYYAPGTVGQLNYVLDTSEPACRQGVVVDMSFSKGSKAPDLYYLTVKLPDGEEIKLETSQSHYESVETGDEATICTYEGFLGIPYAYVR